MESLETESEKSSRVTLTQLVRRINREREGEGEGEGGMKSSAENMYQYLPIQDAYQYAKDEMLHYMVLKRRDDGETLPKIELPPQDAYPDEFLCPISRQLMVEPVTLVTGETYDRRYIQTWIDLGFKWCPSSGKIISIPHLIPNLNLQSLISSWISQRGGNLHLPVESPDHRFAMLMLKAGYPCWPKLSFEEIFSSWCADMNLMEPRLQDKNFTDAPLSSAAISFFQSLFHCFSNSPTQSAVVLQEITSRFPYSCNFLAAERIPVAMVESWDPTSEPILQAALLRMTVYILVYNDTTTDLFEDSQKVVSLFTTNDSDLQGLAALGLYKIGKAPASPQAFAGASHLIDEAVLLTSTRILLTLLTELWRALTPLQTADALDTGVVLVLLKKIRKQNELTSDCLTALQLFSNHRQASAAFRSATTQLGVDVLAEVKADPRSSLGDRSTINCINFSLEQFKRQRR